MTLVADSGSTKTTWVEVESGNMIVTKGLNPHFTTDEVFLAACSLVRRQFPQCSIYFYGAGCGNASQRERVERLLSAAFCTGDIHVETDMLGACRAACGHKTGLVGILGTGSNACYYDGHGITNQAVSTGYILGDEGSANHVGRRLLQDYLTGVMPEPLSDRFHEDYPMTKEEFLDAVYHQPNANRYLASLAPFAVRHAHTNYCFQVLYDSISDWYCYQLEAICRQTGCNELSFVGGFAAHIKPLLYELAKNHGLEINNVIADPIDQLVHFHRYMKKS